ncbi:glycosyltransferase [Holospora undulata]|uniref:Putative UDP-N-acetylglucosamine n=1 Tax=Holospora undulata HU1 TaxID=1321371 RepID=A0A061JH56_9PROT|nr:glycosyltransferase [Holospora undulata]ETZ04602.1 putative UDP-N-acetylglucosamine [Holospora undulata HU1]
MVLLIAGGSGGHIFPAIALAQRLKDLSYEVYLLTDQRGERFITQDVSLFDHVEVLENFSFSSGHNKFYLKPIALCFQIWLWIQQTRKFFQLYSNSAQAFFSFGGLMSVIPMALGWFFYKYDGKKIKFFALHQSDRVLGRANRFLAKWVGIPVVFTGYPETLKVPKTVSVIPVGTPVRKEFFKIPDIKFENGPLGILILGGSQSASFWSKVFLNALELLDESHRQAFCIFHQCPEKDLSYVQERYNQLNVSCDVRSFFLSLPEILKQVHVVFSRCGASSAAELACCGRGGFFVPYPYAKDQHQDYNAAFWVSQEAGWSCPQSELNEEKIAFFLQESLEHPQRLLYTGARAKNFGRKDAAMAMIQYWQNEF